MVAGQEAALRRVLRWSDSLCQQAEEVTPHTSLQGQPGAAEANLKKTFDQVTVQKKT